MDAALSVASCVHVSTSWAPFIESDLIQTWPTLPVSPCYNCNRQHQPNIAVTLQMSHSSFPPCWRKTELVKKHIKSEMIRVSKHRFFAIQVMNHFWVSIVLHKTLQQPQALQPTFNIWKGVGFDLEAASCCCRIEKCQFLVVLNTANKSHVFRTAVTFLSQWDIFGIQHL